MSVLLGNGDGTFQPQVTYAVGQGTHDVASWRATSPATAALDLAVVNLDTSVTARHSLGAAGQRRRHVPAPGHLRRGVGARSHRGG